MSKIFGFLLGVVVALAGPAAFGVLAAEGGIELNAKEMALAYGIGALIFWAVVSYFSGAAALGAFVVFGTMIYAVHWIPNRMTNFLNDVPGVTTGMIEGVKAYTLNGVVPILAVISLVFGIQSIVRSVQRRRRARVEAERLQREQELAQAQQAAEVAPYQPPAAYPVAGGDYQQPAANQYGGYGNSSYEDLFDDEPEPVRPRNQADEQTAMFATAPAEQEAYAEEDYQPDNEDETRLVPTDGDDTVLVPTGQHAPDNSADEETAQAETPAAQEETAARPQEPVAESTDPAEDETQLTPTSTTAPAAPATSEQPTAVASVEASTPAPSTPAPAEHEASAPASSEDPTVVAPTSQPSAQAPSAPAPAAPAPSAPAPAEHDASAPASSEDPTVVAPSSQPSAQAPSAPAPSAPAPSGPASAAPAPSAPVAGRQGGESSQEGPQAAVSEPVAGQPGEARDDAQSSQGGPQAAVGVASEPVAGQASEAREGGEFSQAAPQGAVGAVSGPAAVVQRREEVGQQYRERMEGPEEDETGEHHFGAFENPMFSDEMLPQAPRVMDAPGQFRPAGT